MKKLFCAECEEERNFNDYVIKYIFKEYENFDKATTGVVIDNKKYVLKDFAKVFFTKLEQLKQEKDKIWKECQETLVKLDQFYSRFGVEAFPDIEQKQIEALKQYDKLLEQYGDYCYLQLKTEKLEKENADLKKQLEIYKGRKK